MAFLRFDETECEIRGEVVVPTGAKIVIELGMTAPARARLSDTLGELVLREGSEIRADFPAGWTIFWKIREGESRFLVAHPEHDQWVATLAVSATHLALIRERLREDYRGSLAGLEPVSRVSNVDVRIGIR